MTFLEQFPPLQEYIEEKWKTFTDFADSINQEGNELWLSGEGSIHLQSFINNFLCKDVFYLFLINDKLYCSSLKENRETHMKYFDGIYKLHSSLLTSKTFKNARSQSSATRFNNFETQIKIECKAYDYFEEHKLLFSKFDKVDLLYSHQLIKNKDTSENLKVVASSSLKEVIKQQKMLDKINAKTEAYLEKRKQEKEKEKA